MNNTSSFQLIFCYNDCNILNINVFKIIFQIDFQNLLQVAKTLNKILKSLISITP